MSKSEGNIQSVDFSLNLRILSIDTAILLKLKTKIAANINHAFGSLGTYLDYCSVKKENGAILVEHKSFNA